MSFSQTQKWVQVYTIRKGFVMQININSRCVTSSKLSVGSSDWSMGMAQGLEGVVLGLWELTCVAGLSGK